MQFNEKLKKLRGEKGITQAELAEKIYVSRSAIAKWENGLGLPGEDSLVLLAEFFGVEKSELLSDPETATVIVNKNHTLIIQKRKIVALLFLSAIFIITSAVFLYSMLKGYNGMHDLGDNTTPTGDGDLVRVSELIFETEKDISIEDLKSYPDWELLPSVELPETRIFSYNNSDYYMVGSWWTGDYGIMLPKLLLRETVGDEVEFKEVHFGELRLSPTTYSVSVALKTDSKGNIYAHLDRNAVGVGAEGCINLYYGHARLSMKVILNPTPIEEIELFSVLEQYEVCATESLQLKVNISPTRATYKDYSIQVQYIEAPDGSVIEDDLSDYAYAEDIKYSFYDKILHTTEKILPGSKIYVCAKADHDGVTSNVLCIEVKRLGIESITIRNIESWDKYTGEGTIRIGDSIQLILFVAPSNCSFNILNEQITATVLTPELATIKAGSGWIQSTFILSANFDHENVGKKIEIEFSTPEGYCKRISFAIHGIDVADIYLIDADTRELFPDRTITMSAGSSVKLQAVVAPENATYESIEFFVSAGDFVFGFVSVTDDGVLTVFGNAPDRYTTTLFVIASGENTFYSEYTVVVTNIRLATLYSDSDVLQKGVINNLSVNELPDYFNLTSIEYKIVNYDEVGDTVLISGDRIIASVNAVAGTEVQIVAVIDGHFVSNVLTLKIID